MKIERNFLLVCIERDTSTTEILSDGTPFTTISYDSSDVYVKCGFRELPDVMRQAQQATGAKFLIARDVDWKTPVCRDDDPLHLLCCCKQTEYERKHDIVRRYTGLDVAEMNADGKLRWRKQRRTFERIYGVDPR